MKSCRSQTLKGLSRVRALWPQAVFVGTVATSLAFLGATPVIGDHSDNGSSITYERDNNNHQWTRSGLTNAGAAACNWGASKLGTDNEISTVYWDGSGDLDVTCLDDTYNQSWFGLTTCFNIQDSNTCDTYSIQFNLRFYGQIGSPGDRAAYEYIGCHEFGHTSSIGHRAGGSTASCMQDASGNRFFDDHDDAAINADFP